MPTIKNFYHPRNRFNTKISIAEIAQATLVTDDIALQKAANKFLKTIKYNDLESRLQR